MVVAILAAFSGCRGSNSTYTTAPTTTAMTTQPETPTINNGNGPLTTASTIPETTASTEATTDSVTEAADSTANTETMQSSAK